LDTLSGEKIEVDFGDGERSIRLQIFSE